MAEYTPEFQNRLADELEALSPEESEALTEALIDYATLRDLIRVCEEQREQ